MQNWRFREYKRDIGLIGIYYSGKTVFLTSLLNHLFHHHPDRFPLKAPDAVIRKFRQMDNDPGWTPFDYKGARDSMLFERKWPEKTADRSQFVCSFERSDWKFGMATVRFLDLPGERIADASMANLTFEEWSDQMVTMLRTDTAYRDHAAEYLAAVEAKAPPALVIQAYKLTLGRLIHAYKPYVSPSTFLLDTNGRMASNAPAEELARTRVSGLDAGSEFAPLPRIYRDQVPATVPAFSECYSRYKNEIVLPLIADLVACHSLIVMVDVTTLLAGGTGMYNDNRQLLSDLLEVLDPGGVPVKEVVAKYARDAFELGKKAWNRARATGPAEVNGPIAEARQPKGRIRRIAFVAPKLDLVHPLDRDRMVTLLREMAEGCIRDRDGVKAEYFHCSAVVSTVVIDRDKRIMGSAAGIAADGKELGRQYEVSALPESWPDSWAPGGFTFPEAQPRWPERKDSPPKQINLNEIFEFVMG